jgi:hypothetical protein
MSSSSDKPASIAEFDTLSFENAYAISKFEVSVGEIYDAESG